MSKLEVLEFRYSDFYENKKGLFLIGEHRMQGLIPRRCPFYIEDRFSAFQKKNDILFTTRINWEKLLSEARSSIYTLMNTPIIQSSEWLDKDDYKSLVDLYPFKNQGKPIFEDDNQNQLDDLWHIASAARTKMVEKYGEGNLNGKCIEASDLIITILARCGVPAKPVEGWVTYDDCSSCSNRSYDEHTWVQLIDTPSYIIDVTASQFNDLRYTPYEDIIIQEDLPNGFSIKKPQEDSFTDE